MDDRVLTVTQLNEYVAGLMAYDPVLRNVRLSGEVSNFRRAPSGHIYFAMKDENALVRCVMFRGQAQVLTFEPADGVRVEAVGYVSLYTKDGQYQFYVNRLTQTGSGKWYEIFEKRKAMLGAQGYFAPERKRALPDLPRRVGVVTSPTGAVIHDIKEVAWRRAPVQFLLYPARVQGKGAAEEIAEGIAALDAVEDVDIIVIGRGGGSIEDLWAFNEEIVAQAIFNCGTPVISAVGHETDFTIADFVADVRAPTPSAAAELITEGIANYCARIQTGFNSISRAIIHKIQSERDKLQWLHRSMLRASPALKIQNDRQKLDSLYERMLPYEKEIPRRRELLRQIYLRLESAGPVGALRKGFAIVSGDSGAIKSASALEKGMDVKLLFYDGEASAIIEEVAPNILK